MDLNKSNTSSTKTSYNPYQAPVSVSEADVYEEEAQLLTEPNHLPASHGVLWIKQAWQIFMTRPLLWLGISVFYIIVVMGFSFLPFLAWIPSLLATFFVASLAYIAYEVEMGEAVNFADLFVSFEHNLSQQILLILLYWVGVVAIVVPMVFLFVGLNLGAVVSGSSDPSQSVLTIILMFLLGFFLMIPLIMAMWFAPVLILFHEMRAVEAMKLSFKACLANILPFLVYGLVMTVLMILAALPLGLGYFVMLPLMFIIIYVSYKDILMTRY